MSTMQTVQKNGTFQRVVQKGRIIERDETWFLLLSEGTRGEINHSSFSIIYFFVSALISSMIKSSKHSFKLFIHLLITRLLIIYLLIIYLLIIYLFIMHFFIIHLFITYLLITHLMHRIFAKIFIEIIYLMY